MLDKTEKEPVYYYWKVVYGRNVFCCTCELSSLWPATCNLWPVTCGLDPPLFNYDLICNVWKFCKDQNAWIDLSKPSIKLNLNGFPADFVEILSISVNSGFRSINLAAYIQLLFTSNVKCGTKYLRSSRKRCVPQDSWSCSWKKIIETFIGFFLPLSTEIKYVHTVACTVVFVGPVGFVFSAYPERNATSPLSSCSNKNDGHAVALTVFLRLLLKEPFV